MPTTTSNDDAHHPPPLSALFLIEFDVRAGYTIAWQATASADLQLDGCVEYKSLPSGLHTVARDLVYFVHADGHAGLAAFVNEPCDDAAARNARMVAVGVLVPLSHGRLGRVWRHAASLEQMAATLASSPSSSSSTSILQSYWQQHKAPDADSAATAPLSAALPPSPSHLGTHHRTISVSDAATASPTAAYKLSPLHPAWSLTRLLDTFGPLVFPLHRAALLRKRILISCHAPVHQACDFVYDLSILSSLPLSVVDALPPSPHTARLRPLFAVGVHDLSFLAHMSHHHQGHHDGWIACTTDSILALKDTLWDVLVTLPPPADQPAWPAVTSSARQPIRATQRDLRRFHALRSGLARIAAAAASPKASPKASSPTSPSWPSDSPHDEPRFDQVAEPQTWASLAYSGYMWWASAGEQLSAQLHDEAACHAALLADLASPVPSARRRPASAASADPTSPARRRASDPDAARLELALVTYFHRLTAQMLSVMVNLANAYPEPYRDDAGPIQDDEDQDADDEENACLLPHDDDHDDHDDHDDDGQDAPVLKVDASCLEAMGLDVWSPADAAFVHHLATLYFARRVRVDVQGFEICGVRVC